MRLLHIFETKVMQIVINPNPNYTIFVYTLSLIILSSSIRTGTYVRTYIGKYFERKTIIYRYSTCLEKQKRGGWASYLRSIIVARNKSAGTNVYVNSPFCDFLLRATFRYFLLKSQGIEFLRQLQYKIYLRKLLVHKFK